MADRICDLVVVGAGAAGMTAAATAAALGLDVVVVEKTAFAGGNTSFSGGMVYIPDNAKMAAAGKPDDPQAAMRYLDATVPTDDGRDQRARFIERGREAIEFLEARTAVRLKPVQFYPDYYPDREGARDGLRVLEPEAFDAGALGPWFGKLRPPIPEFTILGGMMVAREDLPHFRNVWRSPRAFMRVARLVAEYGMQRLRYHRGSRLVLGNALAGQLLKSVIDLGVEVLTDCDVHEIIRSGDGVAGVQVTIGGVKQRISACRGVVIATGGFSQSREKRAAWLPKMASPDSPFAPGSTGDGIDLGIAAGGVVDTSSPSNAYWSPASVYSRPDGRKVVYPHTVTDRGKPGSLVVNAAGKRFTNEAISYHRFGEALLEARDGTPNLPAWIVCDSNFIWKYGLGAIIPFTRNLKFYQRVGYLKSADTLSELATRLGIDAEAFVATVDRFNGDAVAGKDEEFGRGEDIYSRYLGDAENKPNPCLGPVRSGPFHAIELTLSDLGTVAGLKTDIDCRVMDSSGNPIEGLYAVGNDMLSIMRGRYPGPGITLGPALTFGYLTGVHVASRAAR